MYISEELISKAIVKAGGKLSRVTLNVIKDFNTMDAIKFMAKYSCSKEVYFKRFLRYGDPYMRAPLAKLGKFLIRIGF